MNSLDTFENLAKTPHFNQAVGLLVENKCVPIDSISAFDSSRLLREHFSQQKEKNFADATIVVNVFDEV